MTEQKPTNRKNKPLTITKKEYDKFVSKLEKAWSEYMFEFNMWCREMLRVKDNYNGFGLELPSMCVEIDDLFENFIDVEIAKTKNKRYQRFLTLFFKTPDENEIDMIILENNENEKIEKTY